jgi:hypothetical protein
MNQTAAPDYGDYLERPTDDKFARLAELVKRQQQAEAAVLAAEAKLKEEQGKLRQVKEVELPEFMQKELGLSECATRDGVKVSIEEKVRAGISKERGPQAFAWLRRNGSASLIKHVFKVEFSTGEDDRADALAEVLAREKFEVDDNESVNPQTLAAFVRERLAAGTMPDEALELLGVHRQRFAKLS